LHDQQIGTQLSNHLSVDVIERFAGPEPSPNLRIDFSARNRHVEGRFAAGRKPAHPVGVIALMRPTYQHFAGA
jgi:hypothetical protein